MATSTMSRILQHLRGTAELPEKAVLSDGQLLECFVTERDDAAFAVLVRRHGPMVWGVCRRLLAGHQDAEDAFQATFLVLVRKAASVWPREMVANWLYGVAHQTARNARAAASRRRVRERQVTPMPDSAAPEPGFGRDLRPVLDQELGRLPAKYRLAIVLCDLEGKTRKEAAQQVGVPEGTLSGRLTRGRALLAKRLGRHGLGVSAGTLAAVLSQNALSAAVPPLVVSSTIRATSLFAAGQAAASAIPPNSIALTQGVLRAMLLMKLKLAGILLTLSAVGLGAAGLLYQAHAGAVAGPPPSSQARADEKAKPADAPKPAPAAAATRPGGRPNFTINRETTYVTGPLSSDGAVDYERALNERISKGVAPEDNANVMLWQALAPRPVHTPMPSEFFRWLGIPAPPEEGEHFADLPRYAREILKLKPGEQTDRLRQQREQATRSPWVEKDAPQVAAWLAANEKPLALVRAASRRPGYYNPLISRKYGDEGWYGLIGAPLPGVVECSREVAPALVARALLRAGERKFDEAWEDLLACRRLGRLIAGGAEHNEFILGLEISQLPGDAGLALLACARPTAQQAQSWLRDWQRLPPIPPVADKVDLGVRFTFLNTVMMVRSGPIRTLRLLDYLVSGRRPTAPAEPEPPPATYEALDYDSILRAGNRWYDRVVASLRIPDRTRREQAFAELEQELLRLKQEAGSLASVLDALRGGKEHRGEVSKRLGVILIDAFMPDVRQMKRVADRAEQAERNLSLAFALAGYCGEEGRYPDKLDALAPGYLPSIPHDLFSGEALRYCPSADGYLLYSVGANGRDDAGHGPRDTPPGDDLAIRMPLPDGKRN